MVLWRTTVSCLIVASPYKLSLQLIVFLAQFMGAYYNCITPKTIVKILLLASFASPLFFFNIQGVIQHTIVRNFIKIGYN